MKDSEHHREKDVSSIIGDVALQLGKYSSFEPLGPNTRALFIEFLGFFLTFLPLFLSEYKAGSSMPSFVKLNSELNGRVRCLLKFLQLVRKVKKFNIRTLWEHRVSH